MVTLGLPLLHFSCCQNTLLLYCVGRRLTNGSRAALFPGHQPCLSPVPDSCQHNTITDQQANILHFIHLFFSTIIKFKHIHFLYIPKSSPAPAFRSSVVHLLVIYISSLVSSSLEIILLKGPFLTIKLITSYNASAAAMVVCSALVSYAGATSTISAAMMLMPSRPRRMVRSSRVDQPPVSGVPVAGATIDLYQPSPNDRME